MKFIFRLIINALFLLIAPLIFSGVAISGFWAALITALILGIINAVIRPLLILLTLPINILTLGLFTLVINGLLVLLVSTIVKGFYVDGLWVAIGLSIWLWIGSWLSNYLIDDDKLSYGSHH
jgi:putative membrane protein